MAEPENPNTPEVKEIIKVMEALLKKGHEDETFKAQLLDPTFAKEEVAKQLGETPPEWDDYRVMFAEEAKPTHFLGIFTPDKNLEVMGGWKGPKLDDDDDGEEDDGNGNPGN